MAIRRRSIYRSTTAVLPLDVSPISHLWLLRLLVPLGGHREFLSEKGFCNESLAEFLGLGHWIDPDSGDFEPREIQAELRVLHQAGEQKFRRATAPITLRKNVDRLAKLVGLSDTDCRILEFVVLLHHEQVLGEASEWLPPMPTSKLLNTLSAVLGIAEDRIRASLGVQGVLTKSGLVLLDQGRAGHLNSKLDLLSVNFADYITSSDADPVSLLRETVSPATPPHLQISDYGHIAPTLSVLRPYLRHAVTSGRKGVNIFLHGSPGTGKSQLAKVLAKELECELFEVASQDENGDPVDGEKRLRAFRAAQSFFAKRRVIILFDEVEDVFNDGDGLFGRKSTAQRRKAWINRTLEENSIPSLWLSNSVSCLDPSYVRRFDMVFELPVPPRGQRERIVRDACLDLLNDSGVAQMAAAESLAPAVVTRAASIVHSIRGELGMAGSATALELLVSSTLRAQGHHPIRKSNPNRLPDFYDPAIIHADSDLAQVAAGLARAGTGRLCLFGPPGTGKTAYGRWLAEQLDMPLHVKRASDLMSKWVGENEQNIADTFWQAERDGALLLIDEVDSFLQDRRGAQRSWELTLVNEMLTQMESFSGVFVASTNLMDGLDQAALRRFDLKIKFDFLRQEQAIELFQRYCVALGISPPKVPVAALARMPNLTPGDFAAVARRHLFHPIASAEALAAALEAECAAKEGARNPIGFL